MKEDEGRLALLTNKNLDGDHCPVLARLSIELSLRGLVVVTHDWVHARTVHVPESVVNI